MKKKWFVLWCSVLLIFSLILSACGGASSGGSVLTDTALGYPAPSAAAPMEKAEGMLSGDMNYSSSFVQSDIYQDPDAKVIRNAYLTIQTAEFEESISALAVLTEKHGGYYETARIESGSIYGSNANRSAFYVVRVPKENFTAFRDSVGEVGHLYSIEESSRDVGENYYDTEARLATLTTKRERLLNLLEQAEKMEDIISLENALAEVQYQIDSHTATLRKYDSLIDFSTFEIHLNEKIVIHQTPGVKDSFVARLAAALKEGIRGFCEGIQDLILMMARNVVGVVVTVFAVAMIVVKTRKKQKLRRKKQEKTEE